MEMSEKLILFGVGGIIGGLMAVIGLALHFFPDYKIKRSKVIGGIGFTVGIVLIIIGVMMKQF